MGPPGAVAASIAACTTTIRSLLSTRTGLAKTSARNASGTTRSVASRYMPPGWRKSMLAAPPAWPAGGTGSQRESTTTASTLSPGRNEPVSSAENGR